MKAMSLEDRFESFAKEQEDSVRQYYEAYENKVRTLNSVDAKVSRFSTRSVRLLVGV